MENMKGRGIRNKKAISAFNERRKAGAGEQTEAKKRQPKRQSKNNSNDVIPF